MDDATRDWLLAGDPAVRWRVTRDPGDRARIASEGWGARLLAVQDESGTWASGVYSPKWKSTTYTLLRLLWLGLAPGHPAALRGCDRLWEWQSRWRVPETCIESMLVRLTAYLGHDADRLDTLVADLLEQQNVDGGWNCASRADRHKHSSFHTSIQVLEALREYAEGGGALETGEAQRRGREFFLDHRLFRSHRTGEVAIRRSTRFPAFPEWHFDVLRGLEHFAAVAAPRDDRLADAVDVVLGARRADGRWPAYAQYPGRQWFELEPPGASRRNTCRVLDVLDWWEA